MKSPGIFLIALISGTIAIGPVATGANEGDGKVVISTPLAPAAIGPYSQAVRVGRTVYISGEIAIDPTTNQFMAGTSIEDQTEQVLRNLSGILAAAGLKFDNVVATTVYLADLSDFAKMNAVYAKYFTTAPPARATTQVAGLPKGAKVEISAIAFDDR